MESIVPQIFASSCSDDMIDTIGFLFTRCVREPKHNGLWKECYRSIRRFYPYATIIIIDDRSIPEYITTDDIELTHTTIVPAQYPGAGEILPYLYFFQHHPFEKAVILQDSMFIQRPLPIREVQDILFLWHFDPFIDYPEIVDQFQQKLRIPSEIQQYRSEPKWNGCFGSCSIITHAFLNTMQIYTGILDLAPHIDSRPKRCVLERMIAFCSMFMKDELQLPSLCGEIHSHPYAFFYTLEQYLQDREHHAYYLPYLPIVKVWYGR